MSLLGRMFTGDEELGKKDDDHRPSRGKPHTPAWSARKPTHGLRKRRIVYLLCAALFVYLFAKNLPRDSEPNSFLGGIRVPQPHGKPKSPKAVDPKGKKPPRPAVPSKAEEHYHDGPIKFYRLASSLHAAAGLGGQVQNNKNILFAASSLASVAEILPLACEMARWERNDVHMAFMGRDEMEIDEIKEVNGAAEDCNVHWHDARPDFSRWSSDFRMEVSVTACMDHIQTFIHPQIIIIDDPTREDSFFVEALRSKVADLEKSIIELPKNAAETMMWMTRLDSGALAAWPKTYVDIFIQAPKEASGALVRLLRSIENADYFGVRRPHLTIELPANIDPPTWQYLQNFVWPPLDWAGSPHASQVTLRHRIPRRTSSEEEASARLVESFYPVRTDDSNVLLLSPHVELSPLYYHYLMYSLLEYKYSDFNYHSKEAQNLMGVSLHLPSTYPNDTTPLDPPLKKKKKSDDDDDEEETSAVKSPFLWQVPSNDAVLYFGNKWMEFHSFLTNRVSKPPSNLPRFFTKSHPAWMEYLLELMCARGWFLLYPNFPDEDTSLATTHSELYEIPEEFTKKRDRTRSADSLPQVSPEEELTADNVSPKAPPNKEKPLLSANLVSLLPSSGDLPEVSGLPFISYQGEHFNFGELEESASSFTEIFRHQIGSCDIGAIENSLVTNSADDLFCHLDNVYDHHGEASSGQETSVENSTPEWDPDSYVHDEDSMTRKDASEAKSSNELASHLNRQDGKSAAKEKPPVRDDEEPAMLLTNKEDQSEEAQSEFRAQMARQAKQETSVKDNKQAPANPAPQPAEKKKDESSPTPSPSPTTTIAKAGPEPVTPSPSSSQSIPPSPPLPTASKHGSFRKEVPKVPVESDTAVDANAEEEQKGAGW